jgi:uncharacterized SAM-binding protein YcdF (DUF218 family)
MTTRAERRQPYVIGGAVLSLVAMLALLMQAGTLLIVGRDVQQPDAFIVLASHEWERFPALVHIARQSPQASVFLTEPVNPTPHNCAACAARVAWLASLGLAPTRVVVLPQRVVNTYDEARAAFEYTRQHPVRRLMIVTSPYHTRRALATFESVFRGTGVSIGAYPALAESGARPRVWWWGGYDRWYVAYEAAAIAWYAMRHRISPVISSPVAGVLPHDPGMPRSVRQEGA